MSPEQYRQIVLDELKKAGALRQQRDEIDLQIDKSMQLVYATLNMLPDEERDAICAQIEQETKLQDLRTASLTDAARSVLKAARGKWLTAAEVRDRMVRSKFDFSNYASNPLASVSTTLRRMKAEPEIDSEVIEGVTAYRWNASQVAFQLPSTWGNLDELAKEFKGINFATLGEAWGLPGIAEKTKKGK